MPLRLSGSLHVCAPVCQCAYFSRRPYPCNPACPSFCLPASRILLVPIWLWPRLDVCLCVCSLSAYLPIGEIERERGRDRERGREGPRLRVTTVRFGAPRSQAAGCLIRLQLPPSLSTRAGGGPAAPPSWGRERKSPGRHSGGGRRSSPSLYRSPLGRGSALFPGERSPVARPCKPPRVTPPPPSRPRFPQPGLGPQGRGPWASRGGPPGGGSVELLGTAGMRPSPGRGPTLQPACGPGQAGGCCASALSDGGLHS